MKLTPTLIEIFGGIDLSSRERTIQAYKEGYARYAQLVTAWSDTDLYVNSTDDTFSFEDLERISDEKIASFVKTRRGRIRAIFKKHIRKAIIGYIICNKAEIADEDEPLHRRYIDSPIFADRAISYGYVENPQTAEQRVASLAAMYAVGDEVLDVMEKAILSVQIFTSRLGNECERKGYTKEKRESEAMPKIRSIVDTDYQEEEITSFEIAVISTFTHFINSLILTFNEAINFPSCNDYLDRLNKSKKALSLYSRAMLEEVLEEMESEEEKPAQERKYRPDQRAFVNEAIIGSESPEILEGIEELEYEPETDNN